VADAVLAKTPQVAAGKDFTITLRSDGTLWASGSNDFGQLGDGTVLQRNSPVQAGLPGNGTNWTAIAAGDSHCVALKGDGTLWSWGDNSAGQLGNGTISAVPVLTPVQVGSANTWVAVAAGMSSTVALKSDGSLWAWGFDDFGQLGNGDITGATQPSPVAVLNPGNRAYTAVSITHKHVLALQADGTLWSWGSNQFGQLGINSIDATIHATPVQFVTGDQAVDNAWTAVSAGGGHSLALQAGGALWSWGLNSLGQLGNGSGSGGSSPAPARMGADGDWAGISAGEIHTTAFKRNGTLWAWGANSTSQLGIGGPADLLNHNLPVQITVPAGIGTITAVAAGAGHSLAVRANGDLYAWGDNLRGQLGTGTTVSSDVPVVVAQDPAGWVAVEPGGQHTLARRSNGTLWAWGDNFSGQVSLDPLSTTRTANPVQVGTSGSWSVLTGGFMHSVAIQADGTLWSWGSNGFGQLGDGTLTDRSTAQQITVTSPVSPSNDWVAVSAGDAHTLAIKADGSLWAWGDNSFGQLGDTTTVSHAAPIRIVTGNPGNFDNNWVAVSAGGAYSVGLQADGTLWAWGDNSFGQLAAHPFDVPSSSVPFQILNFASVPGNPGFNSNWTAVAAGNNHLMALQGDGTAWGLGDNSLGQLGNGSSAPVQFDFFPVQNIGLPAVPYIAIAAGDSHSVALKADGSIWSMGNNTSGQLGIGAIDPNIFVPVAHPVPTREVSNANTWVTISAGGRHTVAIKSDGSLVSWGENEFGQIGDGTTTLRNAPTTLTAALDPQPLLRRLSDTLTGSIIQPLYDTAFPAAETIQLRSVTLTENPVFNRAGVTLNLYGGYDAGFATAAGMTTIQGKLTITQGTVNVNNLIIR
jgi:alpha-tubulin suppressor-like RCC1 family protein